MSFEGLVNIRKAMSALNPNPVREASERSIRVALFAANQASYERLENFFLRDLSPARRQESAMQLLRSPGPSMAHDLAIYADDVSAPPKALIFRPDHARQLVDKALAEHADLGIPLAKSFLPFRRPFVNRVIAKTCRENTLFSLATALPDIIPSVIELPWAVAEFASDTAFLTMNQVRMAFLIAAASDRKIGYKDQKSEIAAVIGSAFGWRALARQLVGKIPFGGGLIGKAAIAYAGTKVLGLSLDRFYALGFTYSREERDHLYADAYRQGKTIALRILGLIRPDLARRHSAVQEPVLRTSGIQLVSRGPASVNRTF
jgi:hypothetical protein